MDLEWLLAGLVLGTWALAATLVVRTVCSLSMQPETPPQTEFEMLPGTPPPPVGAPPPTQTPPCRGCGRVWRAVCHPDGQAGVATSSM